MPNACPGRRPVPVTIDAQRVLDGTHLKIIVRDVA